MKNATGILSEVALNMQIVLGSMDILQVLFFLIQEYSISFQLFMTFWFIGSIHRFSSTIQMLVCLMLFQRFLKLFSLKKFFILFFYLRLEWFPLLCLIVCWSVPLYHRITVHFFDCIFLTSVTIFFSSDWFFLIFANSLWKISLCFSIFFPSEHLYDDYF